MVAILFFRSESSAKVIRGVAQYCYAYGLSAGFN